MTPSDDLQRLVERIEGATGPDREIDRDIMIAAVPCDRAPFRYWAPVNENTGYGGVDVERVYYAPHCAQAVAVPHFTGSIDAAMTLAKPDWWFSASAPLSEAAYGYSGEDQRMPRAGFEMIGEPYSVGARAATIPLAICAAALRARITQGAKQ